jgi:phasin family protein
MLNTNADQIVSAQKAQLAALFDLSSQAMTSIEKLAELNLQASRANMADGASQAQALLNVKDVQELVALQSSFLQPLAEKAAAYSRHVYEITSGIGGQVAKLAEAQATDAQKQFVAAIETAVKNAPQGSETAVAAVKNAISTATNAMESLQKAAKQATEQAEANLKAVTGSAFATAAKAAKGSKAA